MRRRSAIGIQWEGGRESKTGTVMGRIGADGEKGKNERLSMSQRYLEKGKRFRVERGTLRMRSPGRVNVEIEWMGEGEGRLPEVCGKGWKGWQGGRGTTCNGMDEAGESRKGGTGEQR